MIGFRSPASGRPLHADTPHSLAAGPGERWPVVDGIPYLRADSEALASAALGRLDDGDEEGALRLLLAENDRWWTEPPPSGAQLSKVIKGRDRLSLREAMALLGWGRVGDYFAHRWSDPTFVAGLALLDAHWPAPKLAFELACGVGHYLRALGLAGVPAIGADIVFAKLWVARHWVAPEAALVCFDADAPWPVELSADLAFCHDAFYFLRDKRLVADKLRAAAPVVALAHVHNADRPNLSAGAGMTLSELRRLFPGATLYDDEALTFAGARGEPPQPGASAQAEAFGLVMGAPQATARGPLGLPVLGRRLRRNPLCADGRRNWPSPRYAEEYSARATFTCAPDLPEQVTMAPEWAAAAQARELLDLPERW